MYEISDRFRVFITNKRFREYTKMRSRAEYGDLNCHSPNLTSFESKVLGRGKSRTNVTFSFKRRCCYVPIQTKNHALLSLTLLSYLSWWSNGQGMKDQRI